MASDDNVTYLYGAYTSPGVPMPFADAYPAVSGGEDAASTEPDLGDPTFGAALPCSCSGLPGPLSLLAPLSPTMRIGVAFAAGALVGSLMR